MSQPEDPLVSFWPCAKRERSAATAVTSSAVMAAPVPESAVASSTSAEKPLLEETGLDMP